MKVLDFILIIMGVWQVVISFLVDTKNIKSTITFKIVPFFIGVYCIIYALIQSGLIIINR